MLISSALREKLSRAGLAVIPRCPVICVVHVLVASAPGTKGATACLAFRAMHFVIHVFLIGSLVLKAGTTRLTLIHFDRG